MGTDAPLAEILADAAVRAPAPPDLADVIENAGRQRLAAYYLYTALVSGLIDEAELASQSWPSELDEPMRRLGLKRFAPRTERALDSELTPEEQATRRSPGRAFEFKQLVVDLIDRGAFEPLPKNADSARLTGGTDRSGFDLELIAGGTVVATCRVADYWERAAQQLASAPHGDDPLAKPEGSHALASKITRRVEESGVSHGVARTTDLVIGVYPLGTAVGIGTRLVRSRIRTGREESGALRRLGVALRSLRAQAEGELGRRQLKR